MNRSILSADALAHALSIRDLTDPDHGPHAMQLLVSGVADALRSAWGCEVTLHRASPIVDTSDNYDRLHYEPGAVARDVRYTRYVSPTRVLRTHTSAMIPPLLRSLGPGADQLLVCPGLVYRRDCIDRLHTGEPHQLDVWRVRRGAGRLVRLDLLAMVALVVGALLPGRRWRSSDTTHPYTEGGLQIDVLDGEAWVEIGECGLALPALLDEAGRSSREQSGLAMGLGLDRILMLRKDMGDIRLLRSRDPRIASQMRTLSPYHPVSSMPAVRRDLSIVTSVGTDVEELGDRVRAALGGRASSIEAVEILGETACESLPPGAVARLGIARGQKNVLLRVVLRDLDRTLTHEEANVLRDAIYAAVHEGTAHEWACRTG